MYKLMFSTLPFCLLHYEANIHILVLHMRRMLSNPTDGLRKEIVRTKGVLFFLSHSFLLIFSVYLSPSIICLVKTQTTLLFFQKNFLNIYQTLAHFIRYKVLR